MEATHKGLHLTNANFNALVEDLQPAMDFLQYPVCDPEPFSGTAGAACSIRW